jgi:pyrroloquinoline quinone (PQQ) biosynthesis protein C
MEPAAFWSELEAVAQRWSIARHPLVARVEAGLASREELRRFAVEHYHMTVRDAGPYIAQAYLSMASLDAEAARLLAHNFAEEALGLQTGTAGHDELLFEFWERGLGRARKELEESVPSPAARASNAYFWFLVSRRPRCIGALGVGEGGFSQACEKLLAGLRTHYALPEEALRFFAGHVEADREHAETGRSLIGRLLQTDAQRREFLDSARTMAELYWKGWDAMLA